MCAARCTPSVERKPSSSAVLALDGLVVENPASSNLDTVILPTGTPACQPFLCLSRAGQCRLCSVRHNSSLQARKLQEPFD